MFTNVPFFDKQHKVG